MWMSKDAFLIEDGACLRPVLIRGNTVFLQDFIYHV